MLLLASCQKNSKTIPDDHWTDYHKGYNFLNTNKDSAFFYFNRSANNSSDNEQVAASFYNMALLQQASGDDYGAQESLASSLKSLNSRQLKDWDNLARDYKELGITCSSLNNNADALGYYKLALHYAVDRNMRQYLFNNEGNSYQELNLYDQALESYNKALHIIGKTGSVYSQTITNIAQTKWLRDEHYNPAPEMRRALEIREKENDLIGENSSLSHLSDFYRDSRPDSALYFASRMLALSRQLKSPDDERDALQKLIVLSPSSYLKSYFIRYQALSDSLQTMRDAAKNQFALIRYNAEKTRNDNLQLQRQHTKRLYQFIGVVVFSILASLAAFLWYRKRKQDLLLESRQRELLLSQKIHDVVANGLYLVMSDLENMNDLQKEALLDRIEILYEQSRDISYDKPRTTDNQFHETVKKLVATFAGPETNIAIAGNNSALWEKISPKVRYAVEQILQELMVNMKKHSRATSVAVRFEQQDKYFRLIYTDNGIGFSAEMKFGNGLSNTGNRIKEIGGTITFDNTIKPGVKILISLPLT